MNKRNYFILAFLWISSFSFLGIAQEDNETIFQGEILKITSDSIVTIKAEEGAYPKVGQEVDVYKHFKIFGGDGTMGVADAKVISVSDEQVKVQVLLYTSTMVQEGKRIPMVKEGQIGELRWVGEGKEIVNFSTKLEDGKTLMEQKKYSEAVDIFSGLMNDYNVDWTIYHYRGLCYYHLREDTKSITDLSVAIKEYPEDYQARLFRAFSFKRLDQYENAVEDLNVLLEKADPKLSDKIFMLQQRAYINKELDNLDLAEKDMKQVLELDSKNTVAYNFINQYCGEDGPYDYPREYAYRMTSEVITQSENGYTIKVKPTKDEEPCLFKEDDGEYTTKINKGTTVTAFSCSEKSRMTNCVMEVVSASKKEIEFKVLFWANSINDIPSVDNLEAGEKFTFAWN